MRFCSLKGDLKKLGITAFLIVLVLVFVTARWTGSSDRARIRQQVDKMKQALRSSDTNAALELMIPEARAKQDFVHFHQFVGTQRNLCGIYISGNSALVTRSYSLRGAVGYPASGVTMIKTNRDWFFDGGISID